MPSESPLLEIQALNFRYPGSSQPTLSDINLTIHPGEIVLLAGATGSGKSTLLQCLAGISPNHTGGSLQGGIKYRGEPINHWSIRQRSQQFGIVLQNVETQLFTDRVWEEVVFGLENWNISPTTIEQRAEVALQEFGLASQRHRAIQHLSAGQKQRLLLACVLCMGQPVLLLDEPLAYLDAKGVEQLLQLLKTKAKQGQAVLLIEHRLDVVKQICDRAYYVQQGKLQGQKPQFLVESTINGYSETQAKAVNSPLPSSLNGEIRSNELTVLKTHQLRWNHYPPFPDLEVAAGEIILLRGDNGCGKTTLLKLLSGLLKPSSGTIELMGQTATARRVIELARDVGFVLQNPNHQLFADSVRAEFLQSVVTADLADSLLEELNLSAFSMKHPQALSQGQKRRLALGAVLARQPKLCLLDEIVVGQDPNSLKLMLDVLKQFTQQGGALILTSHDPIAATTLSARVLELPSLALYGFQGST
ncbi:MAG: ATP-binding cassette domain-containing protein [Chroococcidiopsidaceae cyanobacterium CP_BM_RX_35]|nr:ATP-binding cassette domain-containing protein [Chroococcidiopsidaceae cyanobacterium CP_BM_RX_35]